MIKPKKALENISPYEVDFYKQEWRLKLDANENIYGCPNCVVSAIKNFPAEDISLYPTYGAFIEKFSKKYELEDKNVLVTNGCDEALSVIVNAYLDCDDEIIAYNPTFSMPFLYSKISGAKTRSVEYSEKFVFNKDDFENKIEPQTKIVYIATPNNPTGEIARASVIELLIQKHSQVLFIIDCTYVNFTQIVTFEDYIDLTKKYDNVAVVKSYSKDFGMAGLRLGVVVANEDIVKNLKKVISPYSVNAVALYCGSMVLNDEKQMDEIKELNFNAKELLCEELTKLGFKAYHSEANFVLCDFFGYSDFYYEKLKKNGVIVRKYSKKSPLSTCLRITVPKLGGVKYIIELLNKKDLLLFNVDGVLLDVSKSAIAAIKKTFEYFAPMEIDYPEIIGARYQSEMSSNWECVNYLLNRYDIEIPLEDIIFIFERNYFNKKNKNQECLIDNEELLISKEILEELSHKYDFAIYSDRNKEDIKYIFEKLGIDKYFYYYLTNEDLPKNMLKPHPKGVWEIMEHCAHKTIKYFGSCADDIIAGNMANVPCVGIIPYYYDFNFTTNNYRHLGVRYILSDINNIKEILLELEKENE